MISQSCNMKEFIEAIKDKDYLEAIYLADKEATEAERLKYRSRKSPAANTTGCPNYADSLKGFIYFMRHGIRRRGLDDQEFEDLRSIREALMARHGSDCEQQ